MISLRTYLLFFLIPFLFIGCDSDVINDVPQGSSRIILEGNKVDTAYLFTAYKDPGASFFEDRDGVKNCNEYGIVSDITGSVNTNLPGTYYLTYNAIDTAGNAMTPVTRTVVVVQNPLSYLNGPYTVACTCTATAANEKPIITSQNYTAVVNSSTENNSFELVSLEVGGEKVVPRITLKDDTFAVGFFTANFDWSCSNGTGVISPDKNSFVIETRAQRFTPTILYQCKNVYTKLLTIKTAEPETKN